MNNILRVESDHWTLSCGVKAGHYHVRNGINCHDAAVVSATPELAVGVLCDGCGEGLHSEVGAWSIANFAVNKIKELRTFGYGVEDILSVLFNSIIHFIDSNIQLSCSPPTSSDVAAYIKNYWLATIMGVIASKEHAIIFWCGDGTIVDDNEMTVLNQNNAPKYLAHNCLLLPGKHGVTSEHIPASFSYQFQPHTALTPQPIRVMVASDGFTTICEDKFSVALTQEPDLPRDLNGLQWGKNGNFGLKKWMNSRSDRGYFDDDCSIITAERKRVMSIIEMIAPR